MPKLLRWWALPVLAGLVLTLGGCSGGGSDGPGDSVEELLKGMVLRAEDLPTGYIPEEGEFSANEDVALGDQEKLAKLQEQGRIMGYLVSFSRGEVSEKQAPFFGVESDASLYETEEGAGAAFSEAVDEARATDWEEQLGFGETQAEEVDRPFADERLWIRVTGLVELGEARTPVLVIDDYILLRQGRARGFLRVSSALEGTADRSSLIEEVAALAEKQVERVKDSL